MGVHSIEKQNSHGCLLEHSVASGTKITMKGPIVCHLCGDDKEKQTNNDP